MISKHITRCYSEAKPPSKPQLLAPTVDALQNLINVCLAYAAKYNIVNSITETECMVVPTAHSKMNYQQLAKLTGCALKFVDVFKYLRHVINKDNYMMMRTSKSRSENSVRDNILLRKFSF